MKGCKVRHHRPLRIFKTLSYLCFNNSCNCTVLLFIYSFFCRWREVKNAHAALNLGKIIILWTKLIIHEEDANRAKENCWVTEEPKPVKKKQQTKWKQPGALEKQTQHSRGLLLLITAKSANIDMLNRLASLITGRVNMAAAADLLGYPVGRWIGCVCFISWPLPLLG